MLGSVSVSAYHWPLDGINICQMTVYAFWHLSCVHFLRQLFQKRIKIQINIWRNTFYKERVHVYMCGFLTCSILIDEVSNYTGVILRITCFDLNCPLFTCLGFWHRLSSIHWMAVHARLKNEFTEDKKCHNLMSWLILSFGHITVKQHWSNSRIITALPPPPPPPPDFYGMLK